MMLAPPWAAEKLAAAERLWLFLDYDGTLAEFAPTPEHVLPDENLIDLVRRLAAQPSLRVMVLSGRRLSHIEALLPVENAWLAGTYGIELRTPGGVRMELAAYGQVRPVLEALKPGWQALIDGRSGFFLEDKGWSLALHARFAGEREAQMVLAEARSLAQEHAAGGNFRLLGGHKFLEIGPRQANKGSNLEAFLRQHPWQGALPLYLGDDDKDEEAFAVVKKNGGLAVKVGPRQEETLADFRLESPQAARQWLEELLTLVGRK